MKDCVHSVEVIDVEKRRFPGKHYVYLISVTWNDGSTNIIYRRYSAFDQLQSALLELFPQEGGLINPEERTLPLLPGKIYFGRSHIRDVALKRLTPLDNYCKLLTKLEAEMSQCHAVLTFFESTAEDIAAVTQTKKKDMKSISTPRLLEQYVAAYDFNKQTKDEIDINAGDTLEVIEKYEDGWWLVNKDCEQGYVPGNYLKRCDSLKDSRTLAENSGEKYVCIKAFEPEGPDDHSLRVGVIVELIQKNLDGWWWVSINGKAGWAPATCLQLAEKHIQDKLDRLDNLGSGPIETISNLSEVSDLLKGQLTGVGNTHIISVDSEAIKPKSASFNNDYESDEFSDDDDNYDKDEEENYYSCITYAPAPKRRNTYKDMKNSSLKINENHYYGFPEATSNTCSDEDSNLESLNTVKGVLKPNLENVTTSGKEQKSDKNFTDELQSKINRNSANISASGKNGGALRPKATPPPPPKRPAFPTPKKKISPKVSSAPGRNAPDPHPPSTETVKVLPNAASESNLSNELQTKLNKLKKQQQTSKPNSTASPLKYGDVKQPTLAKPLIPKDKPTAKNVSLLSPPPPPPSSSVAKSLKQKSNISSNFQHNIIKSKERETESKEKDSVLSNVPKLADKIAKFQNPVGITDEDVNTGNNRGLNLLKRQQEKHKFEGSNLQDNVSEINSSKLKHITDTKPPFPYIPQKPIVPSKAALKPPGIKPKTTPLKPKLNENLTHSNDHRTKTPLYQTQKLTPGLKPASLQVDNNLTVQQQSSPRNNLVEKTADGAETKYQANRIYQAENDEEISFRHGDSIEVLEKDKSGWWLVRVGTKEGWAPSNHIEEMKPANNRKSIPPKKPLPKLPPESPGQNTLHSNNNNWNNTSTSCRQDDNSKDNSGMAADCQYIVLEDFSAFGDEELSVEEGMYVTVIDKSNNDWWYVSLKSDEEGWVPANCISTVHDV